MVEGCPVCDTLWRLYIQAANKLQELNGKHRVARDEGDEETVDILAHRVAIAESTLPVVRRELRRHETARHGSGPGEQVEQRAEAEKQKKRRPARRV